MSATAYAFTAKQRFIMGIALCVLSCFLIGMTVLAWHYKEKSKNMWDRQIEAFNSHITGTSSDEKIGTMRLRYLEQCKTQLIAMYPGVDGDQLVPRVLTSKEILQCVTTASSLRGEMYDEVVITAFNELVNARKELYNQYFTRCKLEVGVTESYCRVHALNSITEYTEKSSK